MKLTETQGKALVQLIASLRRGEPGTGPAWQPAGIAAAVRKAAEDAPAGDVCVAAIRVAADPEARTPGLIPSPGPHWQALRSGTRMAPLACSQHPDQPVRCTRCRKEATPPPPGWRDRAKTAQQIATKEAS